MKRKNRKTHPWSNASFEINAAEKRQRDEVVERSTNRPVAVEWELVFKAALATLERLHPS